MDFRLLYLIVCLTFPLDVFCQSKNKYAHPSIADLARNSEFLRHLPTETGNNGRPTDNLWTRVIGNERLQNTVLAHLHSRNANERTLGKNIDSYHTEDQDISKYLDYLAENSQRGIREIEAKRHKPICQVDIQSVYLESNEYEYWPPFYTEVKCINEDGDKPSRSVCTSLNFECVQWTEIMYLAKRKLSSSCWEVEHRNVTTGCQCLWPEHKIESTED